MEVPRRCAHEGPHRCAHRWRPIARTTPTSSQIPASTPARMDLLVREPDGNLSTTALRWFSCQCLLVDPLRPIRPTQQTDDHHASQLAAHHDRLVHRHL